MCHGSSSLLQHILCLVRSSILDPKFILEYEPRGICILCREGIGLLDNSNGFHSSFSIPLLIIVGVFLGTYLNLSPHLPETIVTLFLVAIVKRNILILSWNVLHLNAITPQWFHEITFPILHSSKVKSKVKAAAKMRANELRKRAYSQRRVLDQKKRNNAIDSNDVASATLARTSSMGILLQKAAANVDRRNADVSSYEACLEEDWITKPEQLKGVGIDYLIRYMPLGLAREVYELLSESGEEDD